MSKIKKILLGVTGQKSGLLILSGLWTVIQLITYFSFGIKTSVDSLFYIQNAETILQGGIIEPRGIWYASYSILLSAILFLGGQPTHIVFVQVLSSLMASMAIYKLSEQLSGNKLGAFIAAFLFIIWIKIHQWNYIVYTDALFMSFSVMTICAFHFSSKKSHYALSVLLLIFTFFMRPTGVILLVAILCYALSVLRQGWLIDRRQILLITLFLFGVVVWLLNTMLEGNIHLFFQSYSNAEIIYPNISLGLSKPENLIFPNEDYPAIIRFVLFIVFNPIYFAKVSLIKGLLFIANIKPYFSWIHNVLICMFLYPIYYFMIKGILLIQNSPLKLFMIAFILLQCILVSLTSENWDGRFLITILPHVFIFASVGVSRLLIRN